MKIEFTAMTAAEMKLTGRFILDMANLRDAADVGVSEPEAVRRQSEQKPGAVIGLNVASLGTEPYSSDPVVLEEDKPKRTRRTKAEMEAARAAEGEAEPEAAEAPVVAETPVVAATGDFNLDQVRDALKGFTAKNGMAAATELLKRFGAARVSEVKESDYAAFVAEAGV